MMSKGKLLLLITHHLSLITFQVMHNVQLQTSGRRGGAPDPLLEVERVAALVEERGAELKALQEEFREFKARYARTVGARLAELAEVEAEIRRAEARLAGLEEDDDEADFEARPDFHDAAPSAPPAKGGLRKLFWSVARMFHPDHASDEHEARRRHAVMAEASRAYRDGDVESLSALLDDEQLQSYCASSAREDGHEDAAARLLRLKEELITIEFGVKRLKRDRLYHIMLDAAEHARHGRDTLAQTADTIARKIVKARNRLAHLS
jgi:hypothetical protein